MKLNLLKLTVIAVLSFCSFQTSKAQLFEGLKSVKELAKDPFKAKFSETEAANAIKEALTNGVSKGSDFLSKKDGFLKNPEVMIPFPKDAKVVETTLRKVGLGKQVDDVVTSLNRAAEDAALSSKDIFVAAVKGMSVKDAINIVKGNDDAATTFLKTQTNESLKLTFKPIIQNSIEKVGATKHWATAMTSYNKVPFVKKVNPDLNEYVTLKAIDALFLMISKEEAIIRKDPMARTSDLLKKVFGK
ncbi:MAG: DUF4197 domain-containing protein [Candidatus Kapaibacteriota bacterium]|jgi:hypothetical protein